MCVFYLVYSNMSILANQICCPTSPFQLSGSSRNSNVSKLTPPPYLRPKYFAIVVTEAYKAAREAAIEQCSEFVSNGHEFIQNLALCTVQMHGITQSASLHPGKPTVSMSAGLPKFSFGWIRCWGRDTFIALRGLYLVTGNFDAAKKHILAFASALKHGVVPNLLSSARYPR